MCIRDSLSILKEKWATLGYECQVVYADTYLFGLPQHRRRVVIVALNIRDPELLAFSNRDVDTVLRTLRELVSLCHRKAECATKFLLPPDHPCVRAELERATAEATRRDDKGFDVEKNMDTCAKHGIAWGTFGVSNWPFLKESPWYSTLCNRQQHALCFSMKENDDARIMFRAVHKTIGRGQHAGKDTTGIVVLGTEMPNQLMFTFAVQPPRLVLGRESFWLQGFPIDELEADCFKQVKAHGERVFTESMYQDLAGNMVSTPVMLAAVIATIVAVSWIDDEPPDAITGQAHGDAETSSTSSSASSSLLSSNSPKRTALMSPADNTATPQAEGRPRATPLRGSLLCRVLHVPHGRNGKGKGTSNSDDVV